MGVVGGILLLFIFKKLLSMVPTLFGILLITFVVINLSPGDPASLRVQPQGDAVSAEQAKIIVEETKKLYGLDKPIVERFFIWTKKAVTFDFGTSLKDKRPVSERIFEALPITILLNVISLIIIYMVSIPAGILAAVQKGRAFDRISRVAMVALFSIPSFWLAVILVWIFASGQLMNVFPLSGILSDSADSLPFHLKLANLAWHLVLPVACLSAGGFAFMSRFTRASFLDAMNKDFMTTAYAKGLSKFRAVLIHAFRFALIPMITLTGTLLPLLVGGSIIVEQIFSIPGMGRLGFESVLARDYPVIMAIALISAVVTMLGNFLADVFCAIADPRIARAGR